jgi:nitroimidazol reductase NimA-like FMN-containing flavoprotein (pyridoxamine 5'-phosphate oxidase superfamily)
VLKMLKTDLKIFHLGDEKMIEKIKILAREKDICVLATVSEKGPYCSLMAYAVDETATEFYMTTSRMTNKYANIENNPNVSLLIDSRETMPRTKAQALTVSGKCEIFSFHDPKRQTVKKELLRRHPHLKVILDIPESEILCIKAESYTFLDGLTDAVFEIVK